MVRERNKILIFILLASFFLVYWITANGANREKGLVNPGLVTKYYTINNNQPGLLISPVLSPLIQNRFIEVLDNAEYLGLDRDRYHYAAIKNAASGKDTESRNNIFLDGLITYSKDLYAGRDIGTWLSNDEISAKYAAADDNFILSKLGAVTSVNDFNAALASFEPTDNEYVHLKSMLKRELDSGKSKRATQISSSLNMYRWIRHFHFDDFIIVNIPTASLHYYEGGNVKLQMRVITGKPSTPTPCFTAYCDQIILYPYWNVPDNIAVKELIPKFRKNPGSLAKMNMQVITKDGQAVDDGNINWDNYGSDNFPYRFRQYTGCENSLGVLKFNLTDPFDIYMHDTNQKGLFAKSSRYFSHGCIRLEKPYDLGSRLTDNTLDVGFLKACAVGEKPHATRLKKPVPVFVVYMPAAADETGKIAMHKDIYHLF